MPPHDLPDDEDDDDTELQEPLPTKRRVPRHVSETEDLGVDDGSYERGIRGLEDNG